VFGAAGSAGFAAFCSGSAAVGFAGERKGSDSKHQNHNQSFDEFHDDLPPYGSIVFSVIPRL
jgi:hypothetical protein